MFRIKAISVIMVMLCLLSVITMFSADARAETSYLVDSDFESGVDGWESTNSYIGTTSYVKHDGSYSLTSHSTGAAGPNVFHDDIASVGANDFIIDLWFQWDYNTTSSTYTAKITCYDEANAHNIGLFLRFKLDGASQMTYYNRTSATHADTGYTIAQDTWYHLYVVMLASSGYVDYRFAINGAYFGGGSGTVCQGYNGASVQPETFYYGSDNNFAGINLGLDDVKIGGTGTGPSTDGPVEFTSVPIVTALNGTAYSYAASATNASSFVVSGTAAWLEIDGDTGVLSGTPAAEGLYTVHVTAYDDGGDNESTQTFMVRVTDGLYAVSDAGNEPLYSYQGNGQAQLVGDRLYVCFTGDGSPTYAGYMTYYDYTDGAWAAPVKVFDYSDTDLHRAMKFIVDSDGYIHCFGGNHHDPFTYKRSTNPDDISAWTTGTPPSGSYFTYADLFNVGDRIYLFTRHTITEMNEFEQRLYYSDDNGATWSGGSAFVLLGAGYHPYLSGIYQDPEDLNEFHIALTIYYNSEVSRDHVYYFCLNASSGHVFNINGVDLGTSLVYSETGQCQVSFDDDISSLAIGGDDGQVILSWSTNSTSIGRVAEYYSGAWHVQTMCESGIVYHPAVCVAADGSAEIFWSIDLDGDGGTDIVRYYRGTTGHVWNATGVVMPSAYAAGEHYINPVNVRGLDDTILFAQSDWYSTSYSGKVLVYNTTYGFVGYSVPEYEYEPGPGTVTPAFTSAPVTSVLLGYNYSYDANVNVSGAAFSLVTDADWLTIDAVTGIVSGEPNATGSFNVSVRAALDGATAYQNFTVTVSEAVGMSIVDVLLPTFITLIILMFIIKMMRRTEESV
jgi:hypothetical protein